MSVSKMSEGDATGTNHKIVRIGDLPSADSIEFHDTSFFQKVGAKFPSPQEIREKGAELYDDRARGTRPPPVPYEELGLAIKYGSEITIAEAQCLWFFSRHMKTEVPTPELFAWCHDGGETFIFMELVEGETLADAWSSLSPEDLDTICGQLRTSVEAWRSLLQEKEPYYVGHIGGQGVGDIIFSDAEDPHTGPFENLTLFHDFFARYCCPFNPVPNPRDKYPELVGMNDDRPVVFTHADLDRSNIIIKPREGDTPPCVVAIIDWHQSGWYPEGWEWMKAQGLCDCIEEGGRDTAWLKKIISPANLRYQYAWSYVIHCCGWG
ncbi:hypothetical protein F5Y15DRAFT_295413 [Xylariaceae sp. FL0016]|nr:hypothetical protein F5Y15DRAFT_295413 [Xylariaceae sp. FL0016]